MTSYVVDRVCETSTTTGTGTLTLAGAVAGFQRFQDTAAVGGNDFYYLIEAVDSAGVPTGDWEVGLGHCPTTTTLVRDVVISSSNAGSPVSFAAGTKRVHLTAPAAQIGAPIMCQVIRNTNLTAQNWTTAAAIAWDNTSVDTDPTGVGFHDPVTNNSRITIPAAGYDKCTVRLMAQIALQNIAASDWVDLKIRMDGSTVVGEATFTTLRTTPTCQVASSILTNIGAADYFELMIQVGTDTSVDLLAANSIFQLEVLQ